MALTNQSGNRTADMLSYLGKHCMADGLNVSYNSFDSEACSASSKKLRESSSIYLYQDSERSESYK